MTMKPSDVSDSRLIGYALRFLGANMDAAEVDALLRGGPPKEIEDEEDQDDWYDAQIDEFQTRCLNLAAGCDQ